MRKCRILCQIVDKIVTGDMSHTTKMFSLKNHPFVIIKEDAQSGRGLYMKRGAKFGETLLKGSQPLVTGKDYNECIAKILFDFALKSVNAMKAGLSPNEVPSLMMTTTTLFSVPLNITPSSEELIKGGEAVTMYINKLFKENPTIQSFEFNASDPEFRGWYIRLWGALYLNAIRSSSTSIHLYGNVSLINHSCHPTVACDINPIDGTANIIVVQKQGMKMGQQLTFDYVVGQAVWENWNFVQKQEYLIQNYGIVCTGNQLTCTCSSSVRV